MNLSPFPFSTTDWSIVEPVIYTGITGIATWKTIYKDDIRIRLVEYSEGYVADHWCSKGHIIFCIDGEMETQLEDGRKYKMSKGMMYTVGDNADAHRTSTTTGCTLFIVD
ncbi:MAG TPA: DHCW motif cupin fold protein [Segetibacter sp.]|jgi:quercetin dioxygenase-like cupin family protein